MAISGNKNNLISISGVPFEPKKGGGKNYLLSFAENGNYFRTAQVRRATLIFAVEREGMNTIYGIQAN